MTRALLILLAFAIITPVSRSQQLPPPRNPAGDEPDLVLKRPVLVPPQDGPQQPPARAQLGAQAAKKDPAQMRALFAARLKAENERKQAQIDRANEFEAARAAEQQKLYQDWHERYLADTPVRVEYYRALAAAYESQPAIPYYGPPYYFGAGPAVILPPVYAPVIYTYRPLIYRTFYSCGW